MRFAHPTLLLLLAALHLPGCASDAAEATAGRLDAAAGSAGSSGMGRAGSAGASAGSAGSAAGSAGAFAGGGGGGGELGGSPGLSAACQACVAALCDVDCSDPTDCDVCTVQAFSCSGAPAPEKTLAACACEGACASVCAQQSCDGVGASAGGSAGGGGKGSSGAAGAPQGGGGAAGSQGDAGNGGNVPVDSQSDCSNGLADQGDEFIDCESPGCAAACANPCLQPVALVLSQSMKQSFQGLWKGHADTFKPTCAPSSKTGPDIVYQIQNKSGQDGYLTLRLGSDEDAMLTLKDECSLGAKDSFCENSLGTGGTETLTLQLKAEQMIFATAAAIKPGSTGAFTLDASFTIPSCGDGVVSPGEQCDGQEGCDAKTCTVTACANAAAAVDPSEQTKGMLTATDVLAPSCAKPGVQSGEYIYAFRASNNGLMQAVLSSKTGQDLVLSLHSSCLAGAELGCSDVASSAGGAERLVLPVSAGQLVFAAVSLYGEGELGDFSLHLGSFSAECGDTKLNPNEQCDASAASCDGDCTFKASGALTAESEPNSTKAQATWMGKLEPSATQQIAAKIFPAGDVDWYAIEVTTAGKLDLSTSSPDGQSGCEASYAGAPVITLDSELTLLSADGLTLATNDNNSTHGFCAQLSASVDPGNYFIRVGASPSAPAQRFSYLLDATLLPGALP